MQSEGLPRTAWPSACCSSPLQGQREQPPGWRCCPWCVWRTWPEGDGELTPQPEAVGDRAWVWALNRLEAGELAGCREEPWSAECLRTLAFRGGSTRKELRWRSRASLLQDSVSKATGGRSSWRQMVDTLSQGGWRISRTGGKFGRKRKWGWDRVWASSSGACLEFLTTCWPARNSGWMISALREEAGV